MPKLSAKGPKWLKAFQLVAVSCWIGSGVFLSNPEYLYNQKMNLIFGAAQILVLMVTVFTSIFKSWKKR